MGVGGYASAILVERLGFSFWVALPCGAVLAAIIGIILGLWRFLKMRSKGTKISCLAPIALTAALLAAA